MSAQRECVIHLLARDLEHPVSSCVVLDSNIGEILGAASSPLTEVALLDALRLARSHGLVELEKVCNRIRDCAS